MSDNNLSPNEEGRLLAIIDGMHAEDYDEDFYAALCQIVPPGPEELDDKKRRAVTKFINAYWGDIQGAPQAMDMDSDLIEKACLHFMLTLGYELGRKLRSPLTRK